MLNMDEQKRDKNGFIILDRVDEKPPISTKEVNLKKTTKKKRVKNKDVNPFKKGSWKSRLYKFAKKAYHSKKVSEFHHNARNNIWIWNSEDPEIQFFQARLSLKKIEKKCKTKKAVNDSFVLIDSGKGLYTKLPIDCYRKISQLDSVSVSLTMKAHDDGFDDENILYDANLVFDSINRLMEFINYYRQLINGIAEIQMRACWYTWFEVNVNVVAIFQDGNAKAYKEDFNLFLKDIGFTPLI